VADVRANADNLANAIRADVVAGTLPRVSWVVTNEAFSEHPDGAPNDGAYYLNGVLEALNADPDVFNGHASHEVDLLHGWYDVTVTVSGDQSWPYVGHLENGRNSVTG